MTCRGGGAREPRARVEEAEAAGVKELWRSAAGADPGSRDRAYLDSHWWCTDTPSARWGSAGCCADADSIVTQRCVSFFRSGRSHPQESCATSQQWGEQWRFCTAAPTRLARADPCTHSNVCARDKPGQPERATYGHAAARHFHAGAFSISLTTGTERSTATSSAYHGVMLAVATTPSAIRVSRGRELRARVESTLYTRYDVPAECAKQAGSLQPGGSIMGSPQGVWWVTRVGLP